MANLAFGSTYFYPREYATVSDYPGEEDLVDNTSKKVTGSGTLGQRRQLFFKLRNEVYTYDDYKFLQIRTCDLQCDCAGGNTDYSYLAKYMAGTLTENLDFSKVSYNSTGTSKHSSTLTQKLTVTLPDPVNALKYGAWVEPINNTTVSPDSLYVAFNSSVKCTAEIAEINSKMVSIWGADACPLISTTRNTVTFKTGFTSENVLAFPALSNIKIRLRASDSDTATEIDFGTATSGYIEGNAIPTAAVEAGQVQTQVVCAGETGTYEGAWMTLPVLLNAFKSVSPAAGSYVARTKAALFSASLYDGCTLSAFKWRKIGSTEATTVTLSGVTSYTMPANTITDGAEYEFTFTAVDQYGVEHELGEWITFTTADATPTASAVSPSGTIVEADSSTVFRWSHTTATGTLPSKSELQYSADETTWTDLATVTGSATEYTLAAGTLTTGTWYWRVRTYNLDSVASEWSDAAQFIAVGKPSTPLITIADNSPRPTITWQVSEQEGYELTIDGEVIRDYGTGKSWTSPRYLTDGTHTVSIRVQNSYGLWSDMATMSFTVENTAGEAVYLSGTAENSATLNWDGVGYDFFVVYRNGKAIAKTENVTYCDRLYAGDATYYVRGCYTDSYNYGISNEIELEILPKNAVLEGIADGATIDLSLSDSQSRSFTWTQTRQSSSYHTAGRALPSYDLAEYLDQTLSGTCAIWKDDRADQRELESLLGQIVCLKTENGEFALGPLVSLTKAVGLFYVSYQISVVNSYYEEEINLDS